MFADDGSGVRGNMKAVVRAILLDPEARTRPLGSDIHRGMLRESFLRRVHLARAFDAANLQGDYPVSDGNAPTGFGQRPLSSPTVFNFFLPDHRPSGPISDAGLVGPEFQIITAVTAMTSATASNANLVGVPSSEVPGLLRVEPGNAADSYLDMKLVDDPRILGDRMPAIGAPLDAGDLTLIADWIEQGAR